nr:reverse transcriptase domain-containing protein [Tanacetum cinerariifolium]
MEDREELLDPWILFTDGSSCVDGSGAGLIIMNPEGMEFTYALRFRFKATNNEAEYEALIAGLRIASQMGIQNLQANMDSKLVANQVNEIYIAKESSMQKVLVEELWEKAIDQKEVLAVVEEEGHTWMTPIYEYLTKGVLPEEKKKLRNVRRKAGRIDIAGSFPEGPGKVKFLIVAIDYFTKWIEAKPAASITGAQVKKFVWDNIVCRFGLPGENNEALGISLDLLEEKREQAAIQEAKSKARMEGYYNARVRSTSFLPGDLVYWNNEVSHMEGGGKLGPKWEGP